jgi:hypothetical protein
VVGVDPWGPHADHDPLAGAGDLLELGPQPVLGPVPQHLRQLLAAVADLLPGLVTRRRAVVVVAVVQADECPVVPAVALGALAARELLPRPRRDTQEQGVGTLGGATEAHPVVAGDRQHLADPAGLQLGPNPGLAP